MSPIDFHPPRRPFRVSDVWRQLIQAIWNVERAFEASGRAADDSRIRLFLVLVLFAAAFATLAFRATRAALWARPDAGVHEIQVPAGARADLVDRDGRILALDLTHYGLYLDAREIWDYDEIRRKLLPLAPKLTPERLDRALKANKREYLAGGLTPEQHDAIHDLGLPGVSFEEEPRRIYPLGAEAEHLIGFSDSAGRGLAGAEKALDNDIHAAAGSTQPVQLALDVRVQAALQDEIAKAAAKFHLQENGKPTGAMGIVVNVHTGEILALSSWPDFDPNAPGEADIPNLTNHEAASVYELGSVFKLFTLAMGLDAGLVTPDTTFDVSAPLQIGEGKPIHDFDKGDTRLALWQVFTHSSNIGAAKLALRAGPSLMEKYYRAFGLFNAAPTELLESARPILPRSLDETTLAHMAFGQGVSISPLALAAGYTAVLNGGTYIPLTLKKVKQGDRPQGVRVISEQTSSTMLQFMRLNVTDPKGSGHQADAPGLRVGGKTGSAQKPDHGHYGLNNISSFAAIFPTDGPISADRYLVVITLDSPQKTPDSHGFITAGWNAAPTAGAVINSIAPFLGVQRVIDPGALTAAQAKAKADALAEGAE
jgi:cell division protein FtsI (penicillin-binding protein 3)